MAFNSDIPDSKTEFGDTLASMTPWARSLYIKGTFLIAYEGVFTSDNYDKMPEDERDFFTVLLSARNKAEANLRTQKSG